MKTIKRSAAFKIFGLVLAVLIAVSFFAPASAHAASYVSFRDPLLVRVKWEKDAVRETTTVTMKYPIRITVAIRGDKLNTLEGAELIYPDSGEVCMPLSGITPTASGPKYDHNGSVYYEYDLDITLDVPITFDPPSDESSDVSVIWQFDPIWEYQFRYKGETYYYFWNDYESGEVIEFLMKPQESDSSVFGSEYEEPAFEKDPGKNTMTYKKVPNLGSDDDYPETVRRYMICLSPSYQKIPVEKVWDGVEPAEGQTVKANLIDSDGNTVVDSVTLGVGGVWNGEFTGEEGNGVLIYDPWTGDKKEYSLSVEEAEGYTVNITSDGSGGFTITNSKPDSETPNTPETPDTPENTNTSEPPENTETPNTADSGASHDAAGWMLISASAALAAVALALGKARSRSSER